MGVRGVSSMVGCRGVRGTCNIFIHYFAIFVDEVVLIIISPHHFLSQIDKFEIFEVIIPAGAYCKLNS